MKIAVVGAGLAGLGAAYFLREKGNHTITIFEAERVGGGASGVCSGLLHPYPGLSARRSQYAQEALKLTHSLIHLAEEEANISFALREGILRYAINTEQIEQLKQYSDVQQLDERLFWLKNGCTVFCHEYLEGLMKVLQKKGVELLIQKIQDLKELSAFDRILLACGWGVRNFIKLPVEFLKGQLFSYRGPAPYPMSYIEKGYIAKSRDGYTVGSTYERNFLNANPCLETAQKLLIPQKGDFQAVKAAVRVCPIGHYLPLIQRLNTQLFVFTGLGSRGLLYHALYGEKVADMIASS